MVRSNIDVKFQYFQVCCIEGDQKTEQLFDLQHWINYMNKLQLSDRVKDLNGVKGRLENIMTTEHEFYALNFMRMNDYSDAYRIKEDAVAEEINLEEDEYLGRSTAVIYDANCHIMMIQSNRGGYGVSSIETYINNTYQHENRICYLRPIYKGFDVGKCLRNRIGRLEIRFANVRAYKSGRCKPLERILNGMRQTACLTGRIDFSMGHSRQNSLDPETVSLMIDDIRENRSAISSAKIVLDDDGKSTLFDLFQDVEQDKITFYRQPGGGLGFEHRINSMDAKYWESRGRISTSLNQRE